MNRAGRHIKQAGMTLVEVMAVLFIVGLTAGIVTLTLPENPSDEEASAQAFARVLTDAQDRAIMTGQPVGLNLTDRGYMLVQWRQDGWRPVGRPVILPARMDIALQTELPDRPDNWPEVVFDPTGIVQPAAFQLRARGVRLDLSLTEAGEVIYAER